MKVEDVDNKYFMITLKVKSVLDPCEDENDNLEDGDDVSLDSGFEKKNKNDSSTTGTDSESSEEKSHV